MSFGSCFKGRMDDLGLPAPSSLFGTVAAATATIGALAKAVALYGTEVSLAEIIGATFVVPGLAGAAVALGELATAIGGITAAFYLGSCIGSLLACTVDKIFFSKNDGPNLGLPIEYATVFLQHKLIAVPDNMRSLMLENREMLGAKPSDTFEVRMERVGYA